MSQVDPVKKMTGESLTVDDLCLLANTFIDGHQYDKAIQIYESACRLFPENLALKINLGRVRNLKSQSLETPKDFLHTSESQNERDVWANRFQGLGEIFIKQGKRDEAEKVFEVSKLSNPNFYLPYFNLGKHHLEQGNIPKAIIELEKANQLNPFHEETVDLLASALFQNRDYSESLKYAVDGFILSGERLEAKNGKYRAKIKMSMEKIPGISSDARNHMIRDRRNRIQSLYEDLEGELRSITSHTSIQAQPTAPKTDAPVMKKKSTETPHSIHQEDQMYDVAVQLKKHLIFRNMDETSVLKVAKFSSQKTYPAGEKIYQEGDPIYGLYLVNRGKVELQKNTNYGPIVFATFERGSFFGDDNLLYGRERFSNAVSVQNSELIFIDKAGLATIFAREREIAIHFLWYFWKSLSFQIRESNERMTSFFASASEKTRKELFDQSPTSAGKPTHIEIDKKLEVLQVQGLAANELELLAKYSNAEIYNKNETIFREGDMGDRLYIVLEGSVLISKRISGAGEEALAILKKGDFFGEMALIGNHHQRSADAKAEEQGTTVLVVTNQALREILSIDTDSAYQLLRILCRILSRRLQEINEKLYQWRMMSGDF